MAIKIGYHVSFNNNETILFSGSWDRQIILWDVETKT